MPQQEPADSRPARAFEGRADVRKLGEEIDSLSELIEEEIGRCLTVRQPPPVDVLELLLGLVNEDDAPSHRLDRTSAMTLSAGR